MKKQICILLVCIVCILSLNFNAAAYAGDDYLKVVEKISAQSGFFEQTSGVLSEVCNGLIYGEFIDFDFNGTEEMLLIYRDESIVKNGFAKAEIYAVVDGVLQCVFSEEITSTMTASDIGGFRACVNNIDGKIYFIANVPAPQSSAAMNEKIVAFTMSGGYPANFEYYGEALDFWEVYDVVYTKCMIGDRFVSAEEYKSIMDWLYYNGRNVFLINLSSDHEAWDRYYCNYERLQKFMSRAYALADEAIKVTINGDRVMFDVPPQIIDGRTMVPMRAIFETFGAAVEWDGESQTIAAVRDNQTIVMKIGAGEMSVGENAVLLDVPAQIVDGRTLVPARAVAAAFGCEVLWDADTKTVIITTEEPFAFG